MAGLLLLALGFLGAAAGGELFLRGVLATARRYRLPPAFVGVTLAAFATSAPELGVSTLAALEGAPQFGLGDALGANVVNLGLVLGLTLLAGGLHVPRAENLRRSLMLVAAPALVGAAALDGMLARADAALLVAAFFAWLATELRGLRRPATTQAGARPHDGRDMALGIAGLLVLFASGQIIVSAAFDIALAWGIEGFVFGATVLAIGTTIPELATALAARIRGHHDVSLGTLLGSNLFNGLFIVGSTALIHPIEAGFGEVAVALACAALLALVAVPPRSGVLGRMRGLLLLAGYASYVALLAAL